MTGPSDRPTDATVGPTDAVDGPPAWLARTVRTTRRRGRMTSAKWAALADLGPRWSVPLGPDGELRSADLAAAFGRDALRLLDIGTGTGEATRAYATAHPDQDVVAVELHRPGLARLLQDLDADGPPNVRVLEADATVLVARLADTATGPAPDHPFHAVRVLFPDPWPKRRHTTRRLVDAGFVAQVADLLPAGGWLHVATDWDDYAEQVGESIAAEPRLVPVGEPARHPALDPPRPPTTYEQRGVAAARTITDLLAVRT